MTFHCTHEGLDDNISKSAFSVGNEKQQPNTVTSGSVMQGLTYLRVIINVLMYTVLLYPKQQTVAEKAKRRSDPQTYSSECFDKQYRHKVDVENCDTCTFKL